MTRYHVEIHGEMDVEADSEEEAIQEALEKIGCEADSHLMFDVEKSEEESEDGTEEKDRG